MVVDLYDRQADTEEEVGLLEHWEGAPDQHSDNWPYLAGKYFILNISWEI